MLKNPGVPGKRSRGGIRNRKLNENKAAETACPVVTFYPISSAFSSADTARERGGTHKRYMKRRDGRLCEDMHAVVST
jgi:hypothetical protein